MRSRGDFFRGNDVYDPANVGLDSNVAAEGDSRFFNFDTACAETAIKATGAGVWHESSDAEKRALIEYLKTF